MQRGVIDQISELPPVESARSPRRSLWPALWGNWTAVLALLVLLGITVAAVLAPLVSPDDPLAIDPAVMLTGPSAHHIMGTDELGRDLLSRVIYGARISLGTALVVVVASATIGIPMGLVAGYVGGIADLLLLRIYQTPVSGYGQGLPVDGLNIRRV